MDLVLSSVLLFILFLPGFAFRYGYYTPPFSRGAMENKFLIEIAVAIPFAIAFHVIGIVIIEWLTTYNIELPIVGALLVGVNETSEVKAIFTNIKTHLWQIAVYNALLMALAFASGMLFKIFIRSSGLDRKSPLFRFPNKWYYILSGEILEFPQFGITNPEFDTAVVDILVNTENGSYIYTGELMDFYLSDTGGLESVVIRFPMKKKFDQPSTFQEIPGKFLHIGHDQILNMNVRYITIEETTDPFIGDEAENISASTSTL